MTTEDFFRKHPRLIIPMILVAVVAVLLLVHDLGMENGSNAATAKPATAKTATAKTWSEDACSAYLHKVFEVQSLSVSHGIAWYYDCERTPVGKYPEAPAVLPDGKMMPPLPYKP